MPTFYRANYHDLMKIAGIFFHCVIESTTGFHFVTLLRIYEDLSFPHMHAFQGSLLCQVTELSQPC
jgi:hypothetical protein